MHQLTMVEAIKYVVGISVSIAFCVWFLDVSTCRRIIMCYGQSHHGAVREWNGALYESLSITSATYDHASIPVLDCAGSDFGS